VTDGYQCANASSEFRSPEINCDWWRGLCVIVWILILASATTSTQEVLRSVQLSFLHTSAINCCYSIVKVWYWIRPECPCFKTCTITHTLAYTSTNTHIPDVPQARYTKEPLHTHTCNRWHLSSLLAEELSGSPMPANYIVTPNYPWHIAQVYQD